VNKKSCGNELYGKVRFISAHPLQVVRTGILKIREPYGSMKAKTVYSGLILLLALGGCARRPFVPYPRETTVPQGIYHRVKKGETLWRIARIYGVELEELVRVNRIPDAARIGVGQMIFIPGAKEKRTSPPVGEIAPDDGYFSWPFNGKIGSYFGDRSGGSASTGISIFGEEGTKILAARGGRVAFAEDDFGGWGKTLAIDHGDGFLTVYCHNSRNLVRIGDSVSRGDLIALCGRSGRVSKPQLYFEIRRKGKPENPLYFLPQ
jgi:hypothetical protein